MAKSVRFVALDVLRGSTIMMMILVNMPGDYHYIYPQLKHAAWLGCTLADLVFPFFLFSVGVSGFLSCRRYTDNLPVGLVKKMISRAIILFIIGILINMYPFYHTNEGLSWDNIVDYWSQWRVFGVLQRIALAYFLGIILCRWLGSTRAIITAGIVLLSVSTIGFIGYNPVDPYSMENNISRAVDLVVPGADHCYQGFGMPFEPEGLYGTMAATVNVMIGFITGRFIVTVKQNTARRLGGLGLIGCLLIVGGLVLANVNPISKALWTASYVLYVSGWAIFVLAVFVYLFDMKKLSPQLLRPSVVFGTNSLFLYIVAEFVARSIDIPLLSLAGEMLRVWQWNYLFRHITAIAELNSLIFGIVYVLLYWALAEILYRRKLFVKI